LDLLELLEKSLGIKPSEIAFDSWRRADQKVYISNTQKAKKDFGWEPKVGKEESIRKFLSG